MKKMSTLEDKGGKPSEKVSNARHSSKADPTQLKKSEHPSAFTEGGKKPKEEKTRHLETQSRKAVSKHAGSEGHVGHEEEFHPEDFNRFGTRFVTEKATKKGL